MKMWSATRKTRSSSRETRSSFAANPPEKLDCIEYDIWLSSGFPASFEATVDFIKLCLYWCGIETSLKHDLEVYASPKVAKKRIMKFNLEIPITIWLASKSKESKLRLIIFKVLNVFQASPFRGPRATNHALLNPNKAMQWSKFGFKFGVKIRFESK